MGQKFEYDICRIPGSKLITYPATGHIPMEEVADQSAADVRAFLSAPAK